MELRFGSPNPLDFAALLEQMPNAEFLTSTRSTVPLLCFWQDTVKVATRLCVGLGREHSEPSRIWFEYPVPSVGRARASCTDVLYQSESLALGIEAKHREALYEPVRRWLKKHPVHVVEHWAKKIGSRIGRTPSVEALKDVVYQMLHRTASVCSIDGPEQHVVLYQFFVSEEDHSEEHKQALRTLMRAIGPTDAVEFWTQRIDTKPTSAARSLENKPSKPERAERAQQIRKAILENQLYEFKEWAPVRVAP